MKRYLLFLGLFICSMTWTNAQITLEIIPTTTSLESIVSIPIQISTTEITNIAGMQFTVEWDETVLTYHSIANEFGLTSMTTNDFGTPDNTSHSDKLNFAWELYPNEELINGNLILFYINFSVVPNTPIGTVTPVSFCSTCNTEIYDNAFNLYTLEMQNGEITVLPLEWLYFEAKVTNQQTVLLHWKVASAVHNNHFLIEKHTAQEDWTVIGRVSKQTYQFEDTEPSIGNNYYRIKQVDESGKWTYSAIFSVVIEPEVAIISYQNPVKNQIQITYQTKNTEVLCFQLFDINGQLLEEKFHLGLENQHTMHWNIEHLAAGVYAIKIKNHAHLSYKIIKQ